MTYLSHLDTSIKTALNRNRALALTIHSQPLPLPRPVLPASFQALLRPPTALFARLKRELRGGRYQNNEEVGMADR